MITRSFLIIDHILPMDEFKVEKINRRRKDESED